jgi:hypothetical protein
MRLGGFLEPCGGLRRIEDGFREGALAFDREADDFGSLDGARGGLLRRRHHEVADAAPLNLGRPFDDRQRVGGDARLDAGSADRLLGHRTTFDFLHLNVRGFAGHCKKAFPSLKTGKVVSDIFPFHNWAFQEGLLHAENLGGDIELMLNWRALIGAFPWRYEGLEGCPCRIVAFLDCGENVEAVGDAARAIMGT